MGDGRGSRKRIPGSDPKDLDSGSAWIIDHPFTVCRKIHWDHRSAFTIRREIPSDPRSNSLFSVGIHWDPSQNNVSPHIFYALFLTRAPPRGGKLYSPFLDILYSFETVLDIDMILSAPYEVRF